MLRFLNILLLTAAMGGGFGYLSFCRLRADYRSTARLVITSPTEPVEAAAAQQPPTERPVEQARQDLLADATLERALEHSDLIAIRSANGGAVSLEQLRQGLLLDDSDEPPGVIVLHCHGPSAAAAQTMLTSVIDAYLVMDTNRRDASEADTAQLIRQARQNIHNAQGRVAAEAQLRQLIASWDMPTDDPAAMQRLSQRRAALLLRRNNVQRQLAQIGRGQPITAADAVSAPRTKLRKPASPAPPGPDVGSQEREATLLEEDDKLALRFGPEHPKRKAIRLEIELLHKYPAEQAQLLAERSQLLQQYGPSHPRLQTIQQRLDELGIVAPAPGATIPGGLGPASDSSETSVESRLKTLQAALEELNAEDSAIKQQIESVNQAHDLSVNLRQLLDVIPSEADESAITAALNRLERLSELTAGLRPYLALRPTPGVRDDAGMMQMIMRGTIAGLAVGGLLALVISWAGRRN